MFSGMSDPGRLTAIFTFRIETVE